MRVRTALTAVANCLIFLGVAGTGGAQAKTLNYAFQGDIQSLDPYSLNETFTLSYQGNIYEGLTLRGPDLKIEPGLAERWEMVEPTRWRFHLRKGVKFHNGNDFTADDVVFSARRVRNSELRTRIAGVTDVVKVDDHTVDFVTEAPNPILHAEWDTWYIMDKEWCEANNATEATNIARSGENYANLHANGTGPFRVVSRQPDVRTVAEPFDGWWGTPQHNLTEVVFRPISSPPTRVAALLSGEMDMVFPVPIQDIDRLKKDAQVKVLTGPELRTIFIGMDQARDELLYSDVKGKNPFKDERVRHAFNFAVDAKAIHRAIMRGHSTPAATLVAPDVIGFPKDLERYPVNLDKARELLTEAGYPNGFRVTLDCPNDRYVNDEAICQAVVSMLGKIGVTVNLAAVTKTRYFAKVGPQGKYDTSFYLLGWTPPSFDSWNALYNLVHTRAPNGAGTFNYGGYSNTRIDEMTGRILTETDLDTRNKLIHKAWQILHDEAGYIPLHQQALAWGARSNIEMKQRADDQFLWRWVRVN